MADSPKDKPSRSAADKERSRQQSRSVNARETGRRPTGGAGGRGPRPPKGGGPGGGAGGRGGGGRGGGGRGGGGRGGAGRGGGRAAAARPSARGRPGPGRARRSPGTLLTWGVVAVVLIAVIAILAVKGFGGTNKTTTTGFKAGPVPASVVHDVTHVPASVFDTVGVNPGTVTVKPPTVQKNQPPLTFTGKPGLFFMGGEYCPFCAAERWSVVATLSRFGTISGLQTMKSSSTDVDPNTNTFTFAKAKYTSPYIAASLKEVFSDIPRPTGSGYTTLERLTKQEKDLVKRYDRTATTASSTRENIPFLDIGNKAVVSGASYSPSVLQTLTWQQIASELSNPKNLVTKAIITTSNYQSAAICSIDGGKPGSVCTSSGVSAAAKALGISST